MGPKGEKTHDTKGGSKTCIESKSGRKRSKKGGNKKGILRRVKLGERRGLQRGEEGR